MENLRLRNMFESVQSQIDKNNDKGNIDDFLEYAQIIAELEYHKAKMFIAIREKNELAIKEYLSDCVVYMYSLGNIFNLWDIPVNTITSFELNKGNLLVEVGDDKQSRLPLLNNKN